MIVLVAVIITFVVFFQYDVYFFFVVLFIFSSWYRIFHLRSTIMPINYFCRLLIFFQLWCNVKYQKKKTKTRIKLENSSGIHIVYTTAVYLNDDSYYYGNSRNHINRMKRRKNETFFSNIDDSQHTKWNSARPTMITFGFSTWIMTWSFLKKWRCYALEEKYQNEQE